jgi:hypothetical protein
MRRNRSVRSGVFRLRSVPGHCAACLEGHRHCAACLAGYRHCAAYLAGYRHCAAYLAAYRRCAPCLVGYRHFAFLSAICQVDIPPRHSTRNLEECCAMRRKIEFLLGGLGIVQVLPIDQRCDLLQQPRRFWSRAASFWFFLASWPLDRARRCMPRLLNQCCRIFGRVRREI